MDFRFILTFIQMIGIGIPLVGAVVLMTKEQSKLSIYLMMADFGCIIVNSCHLLMMNSDRFAEGNLALKIENIGSVMFYFGFLCFLLIYLKVKHYKAVLALWVIIEGFVLYTVLSNDTRGLMFEQMDFMSMEHAELHYVDIRGGVLYKINYGILLVILVYLAVKTFQICKHSKLKYEKKNYIKLGISEIFVLIALIISMSNFLHYDPITICSSIAIFFIITSVVKGELFSVTDRAKSWMFDHIKNPFFVVDNEYGFLEANVYARRIFPDIRLLRIGKKIPDEIYDAFVSQEEEVELKGRVYERIITSLTQKNEVKGYCLMLIDVTRQYQLLEEVMVEKQKAEDANQAKSQFMSNMSHEIRTPMNAIVGMTDILLRSELPDTEKGYLMNIKNSGNALLTIINDILDFSKIESGKLEIIEENYEPMSLLSDLSLIFLNRIGKKNIELLFDIDDKLPASLYGDALRLRQIIINIVNNAIKFTEEGYVKLTIKYHEYENNECELDISVKDTGQGIKKEDIGKLFGEFAQVDTKKNRNKEGTGLGLAISKQLVELMGGEIRVESVYGEGSEFIFNIKQKRVSDNPAAEVHNVPCDKVLVSSLFSNELLKESLLKLVEAQKVTYIDFKDLLCIGEDKLKTDELKAFLFVDMQNYEEIKDIVAKNSYIKTCLFINPMVENACDVNQALVVNKPIYSLNFCRVISGESVVDESLENEIMNFIAPEASILIVDDTEMNLKVAIGLLAPLNMHIDTAENGRKAVEMVQNHKYDLVFMDHMMPIMDGIEATKAIRSLEGDYYKNLPIIALTANAVAEAKEKFREAGMNDFVAKPIELKAICRKLQTYLPDEKIILTDESALSLENTAAVNVNIPEIEGLSVADGIKNSGSLELFMSLLGDFYKLIDMKSQKIEKLLADDMIRDYTIEVHALKNTARMIGALELSQMFLDMEMLGNDNNVDEIKAKTPAVLELYRSYKPILAPYAQSGNSQKSVSNEDIIASLENIRQAMDSFDLDGVDANMKQLEEYALPEELNPLMDELRAFVADVAMEEVIETAAKMINALSE